MKIFLSYCHQNKIEADFIDYVFMEAGYPTERDIREVANKSDLYKFCDKIRESQAAICLISNAYLKSCWCMYEILQLMKEQQFEKKIFPVVMNDADIHKAKNRVKYIKYWNKEYDDLDDAIPGA